MQQSLSHSAKKVKRNFRHSRFFVCSLLILFLFTLPDDLSAQETDTLATARDLKKLSLEELMNIEVTSVSMRPEKLTEVASAVQVIQGEDIHRSGATRLPEALRLASNLQVSQANSHDWAITARGLNGLPSSGGVLANKLLVLIDGRSVYSPLFGGVYWDVQNVFLKDVDRIEVVSGPGGTLWGVNAVNGVINVVTKSAKETQGVYASGAGGSFLQDHFEARYGFNIDSSIFCRVYGQRYDQKNTRKLGTTNAQDAWNMNHGGFRVDYSPSDANSFIFQGDFYFGAANNSTKLLKTDGQNVIAHFVHRFTDRSDLSVKGYIDRNWRTTPNSTNRFFYELFSYDLDIQYRHPLGKSQSILWGGGYRFQQDKTARSLNPLSRNMPIVSGFVQDEIQFIPDKLKFTIGSKFLHNVFSGFETQPSARLALIPNHRHTVWTSVSRAVRIPSRFDADLIVTQEKFDSEKVTAYELGYRLQPAEQLFFSFAGFYNHYTDLRSLDSTSDPKFPIILANSQVADTWGLEFSGSYLVNDWWRIRAGYTYFDKDIYPTSPNVLPLSEAFEGIDPKNQAMLQSIMDLPWNLQLDLTSRYVDGLPAITSAIPAIPAYETFDVRLAWEIIPFEISMVGQNLLDFQHQETGSSLISRSFYGRIICQF